MGISNTTYITCDATLKGKLCKKRFSLPDPPEKNTPGVENTVSMTIGATNKSYYFCCIEHLLRFAVDWIKASANEQAESRGHVAMEELETIPQTPDNFNLEDSN